MEFTQFRYQQWECGCLFAAKYQLKDGTAVFSKIVVVEVGLSCRKNGVRHEVFEGMFHD